MLDNIVGMVLINIILHLENYWWVIYLGRGLPNFQHLVLLWGMKEECKTLDKSTFKMIIVIYSVMSYLGYSDVIVF